jgi:amino acid transporter
MTILPFELIAASITIQYWREDISMAVWVTVFLVVLCIIQIFGVRGYGEGKQQPVNKSNYSPRWV